MADRIAVVNHGRLEQVGTPAELYEHPANPFVAGFIGETNLMDGDLLTALGDDWAVRLSDGTVVSGTPSAAARRSADVGSPVRLAVRPERVRLAAPGDGRLAGTVGDVIYAGPTEIYLVRTDALPEVTVRVPVQSGALRPARGEAVSLVWDFANALIY